jgi:hypothetical protein
VITLRRTPLGVASTLSCSSLCDSTCTISSSESRLSRVAIVVVTGVVDCVEPSASNFDPKTPRHRICTVGINGHLYEGRESQHHGGTGSMNRTALESCVWDQ